MGFWSNVWSATKAIATGVAEGIVETVKFVGETIVTAGDFIEDAIKNLGKNNKKIDIDPGVIISTPKGGLSEKEKIRNQEIENEAIEKFQKEVEQDAKMQEASVRKEYRNIYKKYIEDFEKVFDEEVMNEIRAYIDDNSRSFTNNTLRDEVNKKVSSSYQPWRQLISMHPTEEQLQAYCDKVRKDAFNSLMDLFQKSIKDTNKYISNCIIKYNDDKAKALTEMKESLVKLTSDEETKAQELKKIAEELAVAQFIASVVS